MNLKRLVDEVQTQIDDGMLARMDGTEALGDYEADFGREVDTKNLDAALEPFNGRDLTATDDAKMAQVLHSALPLTKREAADRNLWWWLAVRRHPELVRRRWAEEKKGVVRLSRERMLGQINRNALARLWWGAEMVKSLDDPGKYVGLLFKNQDLFEAVIGRNLGRYPDALAVILDELAPMAGKPARETVRDFRFLLSTLVLECMSKEEIRTELAALKRRRK